MTPALIESVSALLDQAGPQLGPTPEAWAAHRELLRRREKPRKGDAEELAANCRQLGVDHAHLALHLLVLSEAGRLAAIAAELPDRTAAWQAAHKTLCEFRGANFSQVQLGAMASAGRLMMSERDLQHPVMCRLFELEETASRTFREREEAIEAGLVLHDVQLAFRDLFDDPPGLCEQMNRRLPCPILNAMNEIKQLAEQKGRRR